MKKNYIEPYKKIIINWNEGGFSFKKYREKMVITKDKITFKRTVDLKDDSKASFLKTCKWTIKLDDETYSNKFIKLCDIFITNCDNFKIPTEDINTLIIELVLDDNTKIKEVYMGKLNNNDLGDFNKLMKEIIPKFVSKPYFI